MVQFRNSRETAIFYPCGVCNLNCRYCTIDKNPVLKLIDDQLEESFKGDYYFERVKTYFPRRDQLKRVETWGGEPFLKMHRIYPLVHQLIEYYPFFTTMFSSTNFSYDTWIDEFMGLMNCFGDYPYREFTYELQLSVDGPEYINDANRGKGVTEKCIANFNKLVEILKTDQFPSNVSLNISLKGTWDINCIHLLNDKQKLIEFFQFYEQNYNQKIQALNNPRFSIDEAIPNTAVPSPATVEDGKIFAQLIQKCREIEAENMVQHYFQYYKKITPFAAIKLNTKYDYNTNGFTCGTGDHMLGFLPNNMISACHEGFVELVDQYKTYANKRDETQLVVNLERFILENPVPMCMTDEQYETHEYKMDFYCDCTAHIAGATAMIIALAMAGQIDQKYIIETNAMKAAYYLRANTAFCIKNNYKITGSFSLEPDDLYKLLLNGALEYLIQDTDLNMVFDTSEDINNGDI